MPNIITARPKNIYISKFLYKKNLHYKPRKYSRY